MKTFDKPTWDTENTIPLLKTKITVDNFFETDNFQTGEGDSLFFVERLMLPAIKIDSIVSMDVSPFVRNMKLDNLALSDQKITQTIYLGDIIIEEGLSSLFPDSSTTIFPLPETTVSETTTIDATEYFESIHIKEGMLIFYILNDFPVALNNISFEIQNETGGETIESDVIASLPPGFSETRNYDLSGKSIEGSLRVNYSFDVEIPAGTFIDYSDSMHMEILLEDMSIFSAEAIFPEQVLLDHKEVVFLEDMDDIELTSATISTGNLHVEIKSTIEQETYMRYTIPKATLFGSPFIKELTIPAAPPGGVTTMNEIFPFDQYMFDFTGENNDTVNAFYNEVLAWIEHTGEIVYLTLEDSIDLVVEVKDLIPEYVEGYLGSDTLDVPVDTISFSIDNTTLLDKLEINDARLMLSIQNEMGIPGKIAINELSTINTQNNTTASLETVNLQNIPVLPAAASHFEINEKNSNPMDLINLIPDKLLYDFSIIINPDGNDGSYQDFISSTHRIHPEMNIIIPISVKAEDILLSDTSIFREKDDDPIDTKVREGKINLVAKNYFPFLADIEVIFRNLDQNPMVHLQASGEIQAGEIDPVLQKVTEPSVSTISFSISRQDMWSIRHAHDAIINIRFNSMPKNEYLHIFSDYKMLINISSDVIYEMDNRYNR